MRCTPVNIIATINFLCISDDKLSQGGRAAQIRGDYVGWVDESARVQFPGFGAYLSALDEFVNLLGRTVPELKGVGLSRQRAMVANYPAAGAVSSRAVPQFRR